MRDRAIIVSAAGIIIGVQVAWLETDVAAVIGSERHSTRNSTERY